jgi:predicted AAA+ superfamily ATPase
MIDEIQRVPALMDVIQYLIDNQKAQFVLTGSSARKLKHGQEQALNLLPGRLVYLTLDALSLEELPLPIKPLEILMQDGLLPGIYLEELSQSIDIDLQSYVEVYLEEEIRQEGIVRNLQAFSRFLELAALTIGEPINFTAISQKIGVSTHQIIEYYQILEDCMIAWRIDAISTINNRRRLTKAPKFLFFDMGVRRYCAKEGRHFSEREKGLIFEQFIGVELMKLIHLHQPMGRLKYWRDHNGPEVDYVIDIHHQYLPIEVKLTENPKIQDCRHLTKFLAEYPCYSKGFLVCRCEEIRVLAPNIIALPWQLLPKIFELSQKVL